MKLIIVTGMSGAGKTRAVNALEDMGFYCVDNIPPRLMQKFAELPAESGGRIDRIAMVADVRSHELWSEYSSCLDGLASSGYSFSTLFLDCDNESLLHRYKETRRRHPLLSDEDLSVERAVARERELLEQAKERADFVVDTSQMSEAQLKSRIQGIFGNKAKASMAVGITSFGFKRGIPLESDLLFDVRCLPNPFYVEELKELTGQSLCVREFVLGGRRAKGLIRRLFDLLDYLIPMYAREGKSQLMISIGCTGGKHRSVAVCELLAEHLSERGVQAALNHRDIKL